MYCILPLHSLTAHCPLDRQTTVNSFRVGWNFSDGESIASAQDVFPSHGQLAALTLANSQVSFRSPFVATLLHHDVSQSLIVSTHLSIATDVSRCTQSRSGTSDGCVRDLSAAQIVSMLVPRQVVLQSGTNESNYLAPAGGQFGFTFTGEESPSPPDPGNPYRVAVPEVLSLQCPYTVVHIQQSVQLSWVCICVIAVHQLCEAHAACRTWPSTTCRARQRASAARRQAERHRCDTALRFRDARPKADSKRPHIAQLGNRIIAG